MADAQSDGSGQFGRDMRDRFENSADIVFVESSARGPFSTSGISDLNGELLNLHHRSRVLYQTIWRPRPRRPLPDGSFTRDNQPHPSKGRGQRGCSELEATGSNVTRIPRLDYGQLGC
jgi:hypothetical protein